MLNWDCVEDEGQQIEGADLCGSVFRNSEVNLLGEIWKGGATVNWERHVRILRK